MFYTKEELSSLPRKELQKLCKQFSIKANKKNCELVEDLVSYFAELQQEEKLLEDELKPWVSDDEDELESPSASSDQAKDDLKQQLQEELERRADDKLTKIPRYQAKKVAEPPADLLSPAVKKLKKSHKRQFDKLDSIDVYLQKKKRRVEENLSYHSKLKLQAEQSLKKMKIAHNTPLGDSKKNLRKSTSGTPMPTNRRKSFYMSPFKPSTLKVDKEVTFNFVSKLKSPKPSVLKEKDINSDNNVTNKQPASKSNQSMNKSVQFFDAEKTKRKADAALNVTVGGSTRSPRIVTGVTTSNKKTPVKFDLQASLKKRLSYKPHTGKLKESYVCKNADGMNTTMNSTFTVSQHRSVKEITKPKTSRNNRRQAANKRRDNKRTDALAKRRGIEC